MSAEKPFRTSRTLPDGTELTIADITPDMAPLLVEGMQHLSSVSRRQRFHVTKEKLTAKELDFLVHCDGHDHIGLGVGVGEPPQPVAAARCVRDPDDPSLAEAAIVVVDQWQGRGVGSVLMRTLAERALEVGITGFKGTFLADNLGIQRLIESLGAHAEEHSEGPGMIEAVFPLRER